MLRFFVNERQDDWSKFLGEAESIINNSNTAATRMSPNEILYGFKLRSNIDILSQGIAPQSKDAESPPVLRALARADAEDASKHATFHIARDYNRKHKNLSFNVGDKAYIRLGSGYKLRGIPKAKLGLQRVGPFRIVSKIGKQAYELQLPEDWKIHPVISVAQLEPYREDPFEREVPPPAPVTIEGEEYFKIEKVIRAELRGRGRNRRMHYLVRWQGYGPEHDSWIPEEEMELSRELIDEFERAERNRMQVHVARYD
jgi:hypothetical protein